MDLEKQELALQKKQLSDDGYIILRGFFDKETVQSILLRARAVFEIQFLKFGYKDDFDSNIKRLFERQT